jgi:putative FmdB family regulatory protein
MPVYEYQCTECNEIFEIFHGIDEEYRDGCPECLGEARKILSPSNFILKGSGFYVNDYPSESKKKGTLSDKKPKESSDKKPKESSPAKEEKTKISAQKS